MKNLLRYGPLVACLLVGAAVLAIPMRQAPTTNPPPQPQHPVEPPPPVNTPNNAQVTFPLGNTAQAKVGLGQGVLALGANQPLNLAVEVRGTAPMNHQNRALILCVDRSGSMTGPNMAHALNAARWLVQNLSADDEVALISFSTHAGVDLPLTRADAGGKRAAMEAINSMMARGGTNLHGGLRLAVNEATRASAAVRRVVLLSDGVPTEGDVRPNAITTLAQTASSRAVTVTALGVGSQAPGGLMDRVATAGGGNFRFIRDGGGLRAHLAAELDETSRLSVQDVLVTVELPEGFTFSHANGALAEMHGRTVTLRLGDVVSGTTRSASVGLDVVAPNAPLYLTNVSLTARANGAVVSGGGQVAATTSTDASTVAASRVGWVGVRGELAAAATEIKEAAGDFERGNRGAGQARLEAAARKIEEKAKYEPAMAAPAKKMRAMADEAKADKDTGATANKNYQEAFEMAR